ncbi:Gfo/Idh/MocA family oxidoreductase [Paenibacillus sp. LHD-117]|uniref:Gfo/Idh/MocA family protein n=1 Tax=Paenibacillus sp. LHD-117 TaxID=3071412 RepID=UPI0027DEC80F|nr:Gfo/Idh/MocA family oxidoreductase [Paenibacillus sp. LHD-117]MDQ6420587.1 Gfo/Idh/MocA family oxidoreductase [Paenibacillus sp. LHD-117]
MTTDYRIVVAGCGGMANAWVDYALSRSDASIVGLVDIKPEAAIALAERKGLSCPVFADIREAIAETKANLVFDVSIPASHFGIASAAMELGSNVFSEKPLAETMRQCSDLVRLSEKLGRTHAVMQNRRYDPRIRSLRKLVTDGTIGKVGYLGADFFLGPHFGGFRDAMESPLLLDMAIHTFDQARLITGANPVSVYCHEFNPPGSWYSGGAMALCIFEMSDGSVFDYRGSWCAEGAPTSWEAAWRVVGDKGTAIWDGKEFPYAETLAPGSQEGKFLNEYNKVEGEKIDMPFTFHNGCLQEMFAALAEGRQPETAGSDNIHSMAMVLAAVESARSGMKVDISTYMKG